MLVAYTAELLVLLVISLTYMLAGFRGDVPADVLRSICPGEGPRDRASGETAMLSNCGYRCSVVNTISFWPLYWHISCRHSI